ncbi:hypothetical protein TNCV_4513891 [Trichonephila clavipes]|nr:hypothetical protein TNCV_4513891 [Trichonephila clavipes]
MPLSRMENTTFAMPCIIDSHDMGLRTVYSPDAQKKRLFIAYSLVPYVRLPLSPPREIDSIQCSIPSVMFDSENPIPFQVPWRFSHPFIGASKGKRVEKWLISKG